MKKLLKILLTIIFFPLVHLVNVIRSRRGKFYKLFHSVLSIFIALPIWGIVFIIIVYVLLLECGLPLNRFAITGNSMLPTLVNGTILSTYPSKTLFKTYIPQRGDIVIAMNAKTTHDGKEADYVKRVIAIGGDTLRINGGNVYLNGKLLNEPYVLNANSTWIPNTFCGEYNIPKGDVFLMGDNRVYSSDSRSIGLFSDNDIISYLPFAKQDNHKIIWAENNNSTTLDLKEFIRLINQKRAEINAPELVESNQLDQATTKRANVMFQYDDTSYTATRSGYIMTSAFKDVGFNEYGAYSELNLIDVHLKADKLVEYFMNDKNLREYILNKAYTSIGVTLNKGKLNNCGADITEFVIFGKK